MPPSGCRPFLRLLAATAALMRSRVAIAQAPPKDGLPEGDARRRELAAALRELNAKAGLGVTAEDLEALSRAAMAPAPAPMDEVDRLFTGGPEG